MMHTTTAITERSSRAILRQLDALPLPEGKARVCCSGCGSNLLVAAGYEREALAELRNHAASHDAALSAAFRASTKDDLPTNDLISTQTWAMPAAEQHS